MDTSKGKIALHHTDSSVEENVANANLQGELIKDDETAPSHVLSMIIEQEAKTLLITNKIDERNHHDEASAALTVEILQEDNNLLDIRTQLKNGVENWCENLISKMKGYGYKIFKPGRGKDVSIPEKAKNLNVNYGRYAGELDIACDPVKDKTWYEVQVCEGDPTNEENWKDCQRNQNCKMIIKNLITTHIYWFRMAASNYKGLGPWSEPVGKVCP
mgnify:CR=1 FL=1